MNRPSRTPGNRRAAPVLLLAPAVGGVGGLFLAALVLGLARSFGIVPFGSGGAFTTEHYARLSSVPGLADAVVVTLAAAVVATLVSAVAGVALALFLHRALRRARWGRALLLAAQSVLGVPHVVAAVGIGLLLGQSGLVSRLGHALGVVGAPADFPVLTEDPLAAGIVIAYAWKETPFIAAIALALLAGARTGEVDVARTLGASPWQAFRHVTLPRLLPGVSAASAMVFAYAVGAYEIPAVLGASRPKTLPVLAVELYASGEIADRPAAVALSLLLAAGCFALVAGWRGLARLADEARR